MNISDQIIAVIDDLCRRFGIIIDQTKDNIAPYLEELSEKFVAYEVSTSWFWIWASVAVFVIAWMLGVIGASVINDDGFMCVVAIIVTIVVILVVGFQIYDLITCNVFPEKILVREIEELLRTVQNKY